MATKEYPVGTKVIFIAKPSYDRMALNDSGKIATITKVVCSGVSIFIPSSRNNSYTSGRNPKVTWTVPWGDLKLLKHHQYEFGFMNE